METSDLQPDKNAQARLFRQFFEEFKAESKAVYIAQIAFIVSLLALALSMISSIAATDARSMVVYELHAARAEMIVLKNQVEREGALTDVYLQENYVLMKSIGLNPKPLPERK